MNLAAIIHEPHYSGVYPLSAETLQLQIKTGRNEVESVGLIYGDPYDWTKKQME